MEVTVSTWIALGLLVTSGLILVLYHDQGSIGGFDSSSFAGIMASMALLIYLAGSMLRDYSGKLGHALKDMVTWIGLFLILVTIYTFRVELIEGFDRVAHQLLPAGTTVNISPYSKNHATVRIRKKDNGHFFVHTQTNKKTITMLVDTGASSVVLSARDAFIIGIKPEQLKYTVPVSTAAGQTMAARIIIEQITIGPITIPRIEALVAREGDLQESLLGMSFLSRLRSYEVSGDFLILRS